MSPSGGSFTLYSGGQVKNFRGKCVHLFFSIKNRPIDYGVEVRGLLTDALYTAASTLNLTLVLQWPKPENAYIWAKK